MSWRKTARQAARATARATWRVAAQGYGHARESGAKMAAHVRSLQHMARLPRKIIDRSVASVADKQPARLADAAWAEGYLRELEPPAPALPDRPAWPHIGPQLDREAG